jgi:hypothetical protein
MFGAKWLRKWFSLPTVEDVLQRTPLHQPGAEDADALGAYPRLSMGRVEGSHGITAAIGVYIEHLKAFISAFLLISHILVIGETNSGKSSALLNIIQEVAEKTDWYIWVFDAKGDPDFAHAIRAILYPYRGETPIVQVATGEQGAFFNGLTGDAQTTCNAIVKLTGADKYSDAARHFANNIILSVQALCGVLPDSPISPPRSFAEIESRLSVAWLQKAYEKYNRRYIIHKLTKSTPQGIPYEEFAGELLPILNELSHVVRPEGRSFVDGCIHFQLCEPNASETTKRLFAFAVESLKSQMIEMKRQGKKGIIIVDEFPALENSSIKGLLSMARSFGVGVVLATQSTVSLGETHIKQMLMANTTTLMCFRVPYPGSRDVAEIAGLVKEPQVTMRIENGSIGAEGNIGEKETWSIPSGHIAQLPNGHAYILRQQKWIKIHFDRACIPTGIPAPPVYVPPPPLSAPPLDPPRPVRESTAKPAVKKRKV